MPNLYDKYKNSQCSTPSLPAPAPLARDLAKMPNSGNIHNGSFGDNNNGNSSRGKDVNKPVDGLRNILPKYKSQGPNLDTNNALAMLKQNLNLQRNNNINANKTGRRGPQYVETASMQMDIKNLLQRAALERAQRQVNNVV